MTTPWTALTLPRSATPEATLLPLPGLTVLSLAGPDSVKFLQGQTTTDFRDVAQGHVLPGAICSLKGRVLFSFIAVPRGEDVDLVLPADQVEAALAHLGKYAVFSKTRLEDASQRLALLGLTGVRSMEALDRLGLAAPTAGSVSVRDDGAWATPIVGKERYLVALPADSLTAAWSTLTSEFTGGIESQWWAADIAAGFATVFASSRDQFQPQELNYPSLGAVSYNKGCYTGQEVVARLYFRGKLKQRLYRLDAAMAGEGPVMTGDAAVGDVVMTAPDGERIAMLAVVKNAAVKAGGLRWGASGPDLAVKDLPYDLPSDKEE
ncbi:MAG TPA: hypothetical protein VFM34_11075 [Moraxellaceae bacterium]|nr:hypothetical protein [Moraxellaceae bacterium]